MDDAPAPVAWVSPTCPCGCGRRLVLERAATWPPKGGITWRWEEVEDC